MQGRFSAWRTDGLIAFVALSALALGTIEARPAQACGAVWCAVAGWSVPSVLPANAQIVVRGTPPLELLLVDTRSGATIPLRAMPVTDAVDAVTFHAPGEIPLGTYDVRADGVVVATAVRVVARDEVAPVLENVAPDGTTGTAPGRGVALVLAYTTYASLARVEIDGPAGSIIRWVPLGTEGGGIVRLGNDAATTAMDCWGYGDIGTLADGARVSGRIAIVDDAGNGSATLPFTAEIATLVPSCPGLDGDGCSVAGAVGASR